MVLKLVAFSPKKYFQSWRNGFDCALSVLGVCYIVAAVIYLSSDEDGGGRDMVRAGREGGRERKGRGGRKEGV